MVLFLLGLTETVLHAGHVVRLIKVVCVAQVEVSGILTGLDWCWDIDL
jgi:hypothetical protein